jgi:hypothetical protein
MKEQILHLDPHDDFISTRDKMGWVQTQRVLLVWPPRGQVLTRRLDLALLHRHAHRLGAHMALITTDAEVSEQARDLGLPVFPSLEASRRERWRSRAPRLRPERHQPPPDLQAIQSPAPKVRSLALPAWAGWLSRTLVFAAGLIGLVAVMYALIPSATVVLKPAAHPLTTRVEMIADPTLIQVDPTGYIPARAVQVELETSGLTTTTGSKDVPGEHATGTVIFNNLVGTPAVIPQGTGLRTTRGAPIRFTTTQAATIEGRNAVVEVPIQAVEPGPTGNVPAGLINAIDGPLGLQLAVINPTATKGGTFIKRAAVTDADRAHIREQLLTQLSQAAVSTLEAQLQPGEFIAPDSIRVDEVLAETYDRSTGEPADTLRLKLRIAVIGLAINENDARRVAQAALQAQVPPSEALIGPAQVTRDSLLFIEADERIHLTVSATGTAVPLIDREVVRQLIRGRKIPEAIQFLKIGLPLAEPPEIQVRPAPFARLFNRLPGMLFRIHVVIPS